MYNILGDGSLIFNQHWYRQGLCSQTDQDAFYPEKGGSTKEPKAVCAKCNVRVECLQWAIANNEEYGIWGGLTPAERKQAAAEARRESQTS